MLGQFENQQLSADDYHDHSMQILTAEELLVETQKELSYHFMQNE